MWKCLIVIGFCIGYLLPSGCSAHSTTEPVYPVIPEKQEPDPVDVARQRLNSLPDSAHAYIYRCKNITQTVNALRHVGKEKAISLLSDYLKSGDPWEKGVHQRNVALICRLLFVAPGGGWELPKLGNPFGNSKEQPDTSHFPIFPLAIVDGVPFFVIMGYSGTGGSIEGTRSLARCTELRIIDTDFVEVDGNFLKAARKLVADEFFQPLHPKQGDLKYMSEFILKQAGD